ncbi:Dihydropteroate synthase-like protein [Phlyctochytrium arcticum]|nr:Dihydropteroate synthase-like protein [Phlyctochytrium arcticum]
MDKITVRKLNVRNIIGVDSWERSKRQPLTIDLTLHQDVDASGETDLLSNTISYGTLAKTAQAFSEQTGYRSVEALAGGIARVCVRECGAQKVTVRVEKPRALLHAACAGVEITRTKRDIDDEDVEGEDQIFINALTLNTIIGVNPWEREERQRVIITLIIHLQFNPLLLLEDHVPKVHNYRTITRTVSQYVEQTSYKTVEALATSIARLMIEKCHVPKVTVRVEKPSAIVFAEAAGVEITRDRAFFGLLSAVEDARLPHVVYLAVGTNMGDRALNIENALTRMEGSPAIAIVDTSFLYETSPMYVADQPNFLNATIKIRTSLEPDALLAFLKGVEAEMGRDFEAQRFGPRPIDLDILVYDILEMSNEKLTIPHPRIKEREFVLRPLCDIAADVEIPGLYRTASQLLALLKHAEKPSDEHIYKVLPLRSRQIWNWSRRTFIMGILNVTPDSFSDGGQHFAVDRAVDHALKMATDGADMIDIGGMSTRPNAETITEEEELARVIPVIKGIRAKDQKVPLSIDTFRASIAKAAVEAGVDLVNDVTGGSFDPDMLATVAKLKVPFCAMHMRGTPKTMTTLTNYENDDVIKEIRKVLGNTVTQALHCGIRRWNVIVDPGIGFAKNAEQNFDILRRLPELVKSKSDLAGFPILVGPSRKGFLGQALKSDDPKDRVWGTAAACTASIAGGSNVLRVHDIKEMRDVIIVADRCFRPSSTR